MGSIVSSLLLMIGGLGGDIAIRKLGKHLLPKLFGELAEKGWKSTAAQLGGSAIGWTGGSMATEALMRGMYGSGDHESVDGVESRLAMNKLAFDNRNTGAMNTVQEQQALLAALEDMGISAKDLGVL